MFIPFEAISPQARVWIYQANREFSDQEKAVAEDYLKFFAEKWTAHSQTLKASFDIRYNHFIILSADEGYNAASGCSIDASVRAIKEIEAKISIQLFDRNQIAFKKEESIEIIPLNRLKEKYLDGAWDENTLTFNNLVNIKGQLETDWIIPAGRTWLKRYVPGAKVTSEE
jgi:hypothetical protein